MRLLQNRDKPTGPTDFIHAAMLRFLGYYIELENELSLYAHTVSRRQANTFHDSSSHDNTRLILLIMEHRGSGVPKARNPRLKGTNWTDCHAAIIGSPAH